MSTEDPKPNVGEANNEPSNQTSNEEQPTAQPPRPVEQQGNAASTATAPATTNPVAAQTVAEDDEETRPPGDVDFGQLLDQFEQEQASTLQEGEVVRGTVVGVTERGVVIDFGYKSEGIVPQGEFMEGGQLTVKPGAVELTRTGLLQIDRLLPAFFEPQHRGTRYT